MIVYIDENMPSQLANGLMILQEPINLKLLEPIKIISIKNKFGQGIQDEDWIPIAGNEGACVITQDYNIKRTKHQYALCQQYGLGIFFLKPPSKKGLSYWEMVVMVINHWQSIIDTIINSQRPFAFKLTKRGRLEKM